MKRAVAAVIASMMRVAPTSYDNDAPPRTHGRPQRTGRNARPQQEPRALAPARARGVRLRLNFRRKQ